MNQETFKKFWIANYPEAYPIGYELKSVYSDRWFRIHSLPESKRYAETDQEYEIIYSRQNELINDLIGEDEEIIILFGLYRGDDIINENYKENTDFGEFRKVETLELHKLRPDEFEDEMIYDIFVKLDNWKPGKSKKIIKAIADDEIRAIFICPKKKCIVAPYDGGVDVIVETTELRDQLKSKYKKWLSKREDGL